MENNATKETEVLLENIRSHKEAIHALLAKYGATNPRIFGSIANGKAVSDSDTDILVDINSPIGFIGLATLQSELRELLNNDVDLIKSDLLKPHI